MFFPSSRKPTRQWHIVARMAASMALPVVSQSELVYGGARLQLFQSTLSCPFLPQTARQLFSERGALMRDERLGPLSGSWPHWARRFIVLGLFLFLLSLSPVPLPPLQRQQRIRLRAAPLSSAFSEQGPGSFPREGRSCDGRTNDPDGRSHPRRGGLLHRQPRVRRQAVPAGTGRFGRSVLSGILRCCLILHAASVRQDTATPSHNSWARHQGLHLNQGRRLRRHIWLARKL